MASPALPMGSDEGRMKYFPDKESFAGCSQCSDAEVASWHLLHPAGALWPLKASWGEGNICQPLPV